MVHTGDIKKCGPRKDINVSSMFEDVNVSTLFSLPYSDGVELELLM